ncbi:MAG: PAS domain-containing protein [Verrucomicrobia bacterium]|nr:PAS domain-containing protein [Verrucomicrobiota bacterium]MCH8514143.1 PAS domain-containing protein [Kiritimatiellia bacterium]
MSTQPDTSASFSSRPLFVRLDAEDRYLEANEAYCELFGRTADQLLGNWFMPLVHEADRDHTEQQMQLLWSPPHACDLINRAMTVRGWRWLAWHAEAKVNAKGEVVEIEGFGKDVSETKWPQPELKQKLMRLLKLLQDMEEDLQPDSPLQETLKQARTQVDDIQADLNRAAGLSES